MRATARHAPARARSCARTWSWRTSSRSLPRSRPSSRACRCATLIPHVHPRGAARLPAVLARCARSRARRSAARCGALPEPIVPSGPRAGRVRAQRDAPAPRAAAAGARPRRASAASCASSATFPQLEYPRAWPRARACRRTAACGSRRREDVELPPGDGRSCSSRRRPRRTPSTACCAPRWRACATCPCACSRPGTAGRRTRPLPVPDERARRRVGPLLAHDAALRRRRLPRRPRHARARARCGCAVVACPAAGDMNENAARLDWAGAGVRLPRRFLGAHRCAWRSSARSASRDPRARSGARGVV